MSVTGLVESACIPESGGASCKRVSAVGQPVPEKVFRDHNEEKGDASYSSGGSSSSIIEGMATLVGDGS